MYLVKWHPWRLIAALNLTQSPVELRRRRESCSLSQLSQPKRRRQCYQISSLLHSVNLIVFTLLLVHLILRISPHHSHHLGSHHLSLSRPFTPDLKPISFANPFLRGLFGSIWIAFDDPGHGLDSLGSGVCFVLVCRLYIFLFLIICSMTKTTPVQLFSQR